MAGGIDSFLGFVDARGGLKGDAEGEGKAGGDAAEGSSGVVGGGDDVSLFIGGKGVIVL